MNKKKYVLLVSLISSIGIQPTTALASMQEQPPYYISSIGQMDNYMQLSKNVNSSTVEKMDKLVKPEESTSPSEDKTEVKPEESTSPSEDKTEVKPEESTSPSEDKTEVKPEESTSPSEDKTEVKPEESTSPSEDKTEVKPEESTSPSEDKTEVKPEESTSPSEDKTEAFIPEKIINDNQFTDDANSKNNNFVDSYSVKVPNELTQEFIKKIGEIARKIGQEKDLYASVIIAQAILESGSGQSSLASAPNYNLFGIKGNYKGNSVSFLTFEDNGVGNLVSVKAIFRKYTSYKEALEDYANLMEYGLSHNKNFYHGAKKSNSKTYEEATKFLTGKYATDINYNKKLNQIIKTYDLTKYDHPKQKLILKKSSNINKKIFEVANPINNQLEDFILPLSDNYTISSHFGFRGPDHHDGIDLATSFGTPIYVSSEGQVINTGFDSSAGNYVIVKHPNGLYTNYFHMSETNVTVGQTIQIGEVIGYVGSTGNSTGPHLHFGISTNEWHNYLNPSDYLDFN
ncbi:glucosaminidase domain-containing protein [Enterococcus gallinarum]|uniref:glucosaminidase domain-containing protein n=2 Tax=Enterococcus gallinarum TaxID=1353 RepID=UPI00214B5264|nr:peptidoglycan DD-metalloendopeptidase family protein [Enterococcus gallinarum]